MFPYKSVELTLKGVYTFMTNLIWSFMIVYPTSKVFNHCTMFSIHLIHQVDYIVAYTLFKSFHQTNTTKMAEWLVYVMYIIACDLIYK